MQVQVLSRVLKDLTFALVCAIMVLMKPKYTDSAVKEAVGKCRSWPEVCYGYPTKIEWPETEVLLNRLANSSYTQVAKELGVTDNAIRRHLKR